jgi:PhnB protein
MTETIQPIPTGYHTLTPFMVIKDATAAIEFYEKAFGAEKRGILNAPDGKVMHAEIKIGDSIIMISDEFPEMKTLGPLSRGGVSMSLMLYVTDADATFDKAVKAGCKVIVPLANQFWGDRYGKVSDPFGHEWSIGTHVEDVPMEEMKPRAEKAMCMNKS